MMIEKFLNYMRYERNKSPLTVQSYGKDLRDFESYIKNLDNHLSLEKADADLIRGWMESMVDKGNTATSVNRRLSALRSFFRYALSEGIVSSDPSHTIKGPKTGKPLPQFVRECEMDDLLDMQAKADSFKEVRARTIILLFYETGVRVAELVALNDSSVDFVNKTVRVLGKGGKQRLVPFGEELAEALAEYVKVRDENVAALDDALFVTPRGRRLNTDQVRYIVKKSLANVTAIKKKSPHVLRHTFATAMLNHGANIESIKMLLGHEKVETTEIYTHTTFEQLRQVYKQAHPRA